MAYRDLREFLERIEGMGELHRVAAEVDPVLEIAEITDRVSKSAGGGKALLFERVTGSPFPVATNLFGSFRRLCAALEITEPDELARRMGGLLRRLPAAPLARKLASLQQVPEFARFVPDVVADGACREVVEHGFDLTLLPALQCWPGDGGRALTLPLVFSRDPESGRPNCGMYRLQIFDAGSAGIHWRDGSGGAGHWRKYAERGERMPVAVAVGGDPAIIYAASAPLPEPLDEMQLAGFLRGKPVELVRCVTCDLMVPANAELVIEGYVEPGEKRSGGAFGNHTGFYAPVGDVPVLHVTCVTRRREALFPATVIGPPPMEDCFLAKASERLLLPLVREDLPEVVDMNLPMEGIFHGCAVVAIEKSRPGHGREVITALWGGGVLRHARLLVIVDGDLNIRDLSRIGWRLLNGVDWERDLLLDGARGAAYYPETFPFIGCRMGIDATRKSTKEGMLRDWPREVAMDGGVRRMVDERWREYGFR